MNNEQPNQPKKQAPPDLPPWIISHLAGVDIGSELLHKHLDAAVRALIDDNQNLRQQVKVLEQRIQELTQPTFTVKPESRTPA